MLLFREHFEANVIIVGAGGIYRFCHLFQETPREI